MEWLLTIPDALVAFFEWLFARMQVLVPLARGFGELVTTLLILSAPALIAFGVTRWVTLTTKRSMGHIDAVVTYTIFAIAAAGGLGSIIGAAASIGGVGLIGVIIWTCMTAVGFLVGGRKALGNVTAGIVSGLIIPMSLLAGLTIYAI